MHFLCGVDNSTTGRNAAFVAAHVANRVSGRLTLMRVVTHGVTTRSAGTAPSGSPLHLQAASAVTEAARRELEMLANEIAVSVGFRPATRIESGNPAVHLLAAAAETAANVIVIGSVPRGRLGDAMFAETRDRLTQDARCPVMVVPESAPLPTGRGVALAFETPAVSDDAAAVAARLSLQLDTAMTVVHVLSNPRAYAEPILPRYRAASEAVDAAVSDGHLTVKHAAAYRNPAGSLRGTIGDADPALIVVGATRRANWLNLLRPSVAAQLLRHATHPVLVVPVGASLPDELSTPATVSSGSRPSQMAGSAAI
jgi:nucleotide-binding universal stress UspA family protein